MSILKVDTLQPATGARVLSAGHIVQVVQGETNTVYSSASTSYGDTGLSATITPTSTSSKILISLAQHYRFDRYGFSIKVLRGSTDVNSPAGRYMVYSQDANDDLRGYHNYTLIDSPSTTSATTYKTQAALSDSSGVNLQLNGNSFYSFLTIMEITQRVAY